MVGWTWGSGMPRGPMVGWTRGSGVPRGPMVGWTRGSGLPRGPMVGCEGLGVGACRDLAPNGPLLKQPRHVPHPLDGRQVCEQR